MAIAPFLASVTEMCGLKQSTTFDRRGLTTRRFKMGSLLVFAEALALQEAKEPGFQFIVAQVDGL